MSIFGIGSVISTVMSVINKFIPDKDAQERIQAELIKAQIEVNQVESTHESIFVAGWRPFIGWVCGIAFAYHYIALPIILLISAYNHIAVQLPVFDMLTLLNVLGGMLGLGGLRTYEKIIDKKLKQPQFGPGSRNFQGEE